MKPLLSKTTRPFLAYTLIVFALSVPVYYWVVDAIWSAELDEHNRIVADNAAYKLKTLQLTEDELEKTIKFWNLMQPGTSIQKTDDALITDSIYSMYKQKSYTTDESVDRFRCLTTTIYINQSPYRLTVETNIEESHEIIGVMAAISMLFFLLVLTGLLFLTRRISIKVWKPFNENLQRLQLFDLSKQKQLSFAETDIKEFDELNSALTKIIDHSITVYKSQKEFTENAAHELQTPLAILKNKLDILLQTENLTEVQYNIAEDMNRALLRSTRINKNLLLLAKIENSQYNNSESVRLDLSLYQAVDSFKVFFDEKNISYSVDIAAKIMISGNSSLVEVMLNNLLQNAVRHTPPYGIVSISLNEHQLEISNSGIKGLDSNTLFKRFLRSSADNSGSGLGLAIVFEIVKRHNWTIQYNHNTDKHIFRLTF